tara:strand:- start:1271 stop:1912 length:642 start_codon:yes stop_codon:yes gene_type:complete
MNQQEKIDLAEALLKKYLELGFGSQPKSELDMLVFYHINRSNESKKLSNYQLASKLKIPEGQVKRLKLSSALRYGTINSKAILGEIVLRTMDGSQVLDLRAGKIEISLEDPLEKRELENYLKEGGHSAEYTLNTEVLKIEPIRLLELMIENVDRAEKEFAAVLTASLEDQVLSGKILGENSSIDKQLKRVREHLDDASKILGICKALGLLAAA